MIKIEINVYSSGKERLCKDCNDAPRKPYLVRGHFRVINGKRVYVKPHYRNR